jgi:uncharacterized protein
MSDTKQGEVIVIYHSADYDGIFCREIARKFVPEATLIGWDYGDEIPVIHPEASLVMLDISIESLMSHPVLTWIDHHKTAIEKYGGLFDNQILRQAYLIDGVAACRLAWQYFTRFREIGEIAGLPDKSAYLDRTVNEPLAVRLAGEYDIWDKRDERADIFQFGLRSRNLDNLWDLMLVNPESDVCGRQDVGTITVEALLDDGRLIQAYQQNNDKGMMGRSFVFNWEGLKFLTLNTARCNSLTFAARDLPETGHDALMGFFFNGRAWKFSLYHAAHRTDMDLSAIAAKYGGGGHMGACGFETESIFDIVNSVIWDVPRSAS